MKRLGLEYIYGDILFIFIQNVYYQISTFISCLNYYKRQERIQTIKRDHQSGIGSMYKNIYWK